MEKIVMFAVTVIIMIVLVSIIIDAGIIVLPTM